MKWYLAKLIYRIICGDGFHTPQFDEQLRLISAGDDLHAFQKARLTGHNEEDTFFNEKQKMVQWKFIDVSELTLLDELTDGAEMYSRITELEDATEYLKLITLRSQHLQESCTEKVFPSN